MNQPAVDDDDRTTPTGLARFAFEYIEAACLVDDHALEVRPKRVISPTPAYFLAHHGIELSLKAFLRLKGLSARELRRKTYGHDIRACYRKAKELGLLDVFREHQNDIAAMHLLAELNVNHGLRYIQTGAKRVPSWAIVKPLAVRLHQAVSPLVGFNTFSMTFSAYE